MVRWAALAVRSGGATIVELGALQFRQLLSGSAFGDLPADTLRAMIAQHQIIETPTRSTLYSEEDSPRITLLIDGVLRVWIASADGREMTIRYVRRGEFVGIPTFLIGPAAVRVSAMTPCRICFFHADVVRSLALADGAVALALARECAFNLFDLIERTSSAAFGTIRQKLARDLLDLGTEQDGHIQVRLSSQELASAIGSVREVVARTLSDFRAEGLIETRSGAITLIDLAGLRAIVDIGLPAR